MLQRISERIESLPVEDWAAGAGRAWRRTRRRLARRKARVAIAGLFALVVVAVGGNALWSQAGSHPAPLWGERDPARVALAAHGGAPARVARAREEVEASDMVAEVQEGLRAAGIYDGPTTGELDVATEDAIRAFERVSGLSETGEPSVMLLAAITAEDEAAPSEAEFAGEERVPAGEPRPVETAARAAPSSVAEIQRLLNARGFGPLDVDGQMGRRTRQALDAFAAQAGLGERDGLSPEVLQALAGG